MDEHSEKRAAGGVVTPRKGSRLVLRDTTDNRDQNAQFCNRIGCNGRLNYTKGSQAGCSQKHKPSSSALRSPNGKEVLGSSVRTYPTINGRRKSFQEPQKKQLPKPETETSRTQDEPERSKLTPSRGTTQTCSLSEVKNSGSDDLGVSEVGTSSTASISRPRKMLKQRSGLSNQLGLSPPVTPKSPVEGSRSSVSSSRYGLRNLKCNSISDVLPSGCSSSESHLNRRMDMVKKRAPEGEGSSSARGKKMIGRPEEGRSTVSRNGISISDDSRRARNGPPSMDNGVASVRTRRSVNGNSTRTKHSNQGNGKITSATNSRVIMPQMPDPEIPSGSSNPSSSLHFSAESSSSRSNSHSRPNSSGGNIPSTMPFDIGSQGITRSSINRDALRQYNLDSIAEVLLALERIEHDEDLTYEQLLALETNLFLGGLSFHDQHRDMRLDIDNMSYEELLALEDKMGTVSTALSEEALSRCLKRSIYQPTPLAEVNVGCSSEEDETKCSICQEEYEVGDEVGRLECEHGYHVECVEQWLRLKNWCPICKGSAASSHHSSSPSTSFS